MYRRFVRYLADGNTEYIRSFVNKSFDGKGSIDVTDKNGSDKLKKPCSILNDLWLEIALSPLEILSKMRALAFICNEPLSGIRITCINRAEEACGNPSSQIPLTDSSSVESGSNCRISCDALSETDKKAATERDFKDWIREHVPYFVARGVMQDLAKAFEIAGREWDDNVFSYELHVVEDIYQKVYAFDEDREARNSLLLALQIYSYFRKDDFICLTKGEEPLADENESGRLSDEIRLESEKALFCERERRIAAEEKLKFLEEAISVSEASRIEAETNLALEKELRIAAEEKLAASEEALRVSEDARITAEEEALGLSEEACGKAEEEDLGLSEEACVNAEEEDLGLSDEACITAEEDAWGVYDEEVELLRMILDRALASGGDIVFYESLFDRDKDELYECGIEDIESLKLKIASCMPDIILKDEYLYVKNDASIENDIKSAFRGCVIKSLSEIDFSLPYMNEYRIAEFMADSPDFICDEYGRYVSLEKIFISDRDVEVSSNRIISDIDNNGF
ncbi:MAG: hypothetical protein MJ234_04435, partial [bacterium]|nr:hypothetical protein [bacterium]